MTGTEKRLEASDWPRDRVVGIDTTLSFHESLLKSTEFREARVHTRWIEENFMMEKDL